MTDRLQRRLNIEGDRDNVLDVLDFYNDEPTGAFFEVDLDAVCTPCWVAGKTKIGPHTRASCSPRTLPYLPVALALLYL